MSKKFILALFCSMGVALPFAAVAQLPTTPAGGGTSAPTGGGMSAPASQDPTAPAGGGMSAPAQDPTAPTGGGMSAPAPGNMTKPPQKMSPKSTKPGKSSTKTVSVNSATAAEMIKVKGIGPATAKKIIANRPYASLDDLVTKKVLTKSQLTQLKSQLSL